MLIREARPEEAGALIALFRDTVRTVNRRDYSPAQLRAWAPDAIDRQAWARRIAANRSLLAETGGAVAGFAELRNDGRIAMLFVARRQQRRGVATRLLARIETLARADGHVLLSAEASLTARPFFARHGFRVVRTQRVARAGQHLVNFLMEKELGRDAAG